MQLKFMLLWCLLAVLVIFGADAGGGGGGHGKHVKVYVPYNEKTIKHTHTIYKTIHHHHKHEDDGGHHAHDHHDHGHEGFGGHGGWF